MSSPSTLRAVKIIAVLNMFYIPPYLISISVIAFEMRYLDITVGPLFKHVCLFLPNMNDNCIIHVHYLQIYVSYSASYHVLHAGFHMGGSQVRWIRNVVRNGHKKCIPVKSPRAMIVYLDN